MPDEDLADKGVDVRFTYDVNGLLQVEATVLCTGKTEVLLIQGNPGLLSDEDIAQRLASLSQLKIHPRERIAFRTLTARAERMFQELRGEERERLGERIMQFERALESQDSRVFRPAAKAFLALLDDIEQAARVLPLGAGEDA